MIPRDKDRQNCLPKVNIPPAPSSPNHNTNLYNLRAPKTEETAEFKEE